MKVMCTAAGLGITLWATILGGCGSRSLLELADGPDVVPGDAADAADAGPGEEDPPPSSCWSEPICIEADLRYADRTLFYREAGTLSSGPRVLWAFGAAVEDRSFRVKLFRRATAGRHPWDFTGGDVFVVADLGGERCAMLDDITLDVADTTAGGVTEGRFSGRTGPGCRSVQVEVQGRFRVTAD